MAAHSFETPSAPARLLGIPLGDFGFFRSLLLAASAGFLVFFASCFFAIFGIFFYNQAGHHHVDLADSYRYVAFPAGVAVLVFGLLFFTGTWLVRRVSGK